MAKSLNKNIKQKATKPISRAKIPGFNYNEFKIKNANKFLYLSAVLLCLLLISVFKNISHPLFWADEGMTANGSARVLEYGYPKVHDGKNIFYDLRHSNPKLGINEKDDAYVGGTGWGQYYFGTIGYKLAERTDNIYTKTGIYRTTFAIAGLLGLFLIVFFMSGFFPDKFTKYAFVSLFILLSLFSVSLALLLREVRYYSLVIFLSGLIISIYCVFRFNKPFNRIILISIEALALWMLFYTFSPVYFIINITIVISELVVLIFYYLKSNINSAIKKVIPAIAFLIIPLIGIIPFLSYFKYFEISKAISELNGFSREMYWDNVTVIFKYFKNFELLFLSITLKVFLIFHLKKILSEKATIFKVSSFLTLFILIAIFVSARIPNFIYTRYIIYLQPFLSVMIIFDFFIILRLYFNHDTSLIKLKVLLPFIIFIGFFIFNILNNLQNINGHIYELSHQYKGPLDYTIPFIKENYSRPDTLVIAANYEETSYMYYLKCKVIVGYIGNNLKEDSLLNPHILAYRKTCGKHKNVFISFSQKAFYDRIGFPVYDGPVNNIAELNFIPAFNHQFRTRYTDSIEIAACLYIRK